MTATLAPDLARDFLLASRTHLAGEYLPKIRHCLGKLSEEDLWWRPNPESNSVGNLILHLCGNAEQWIVHGVCGQPDQRDRDGEFAATDGMSLGEMRVHLDRSIEKVDAALMSVEAHASGHPALMFEERTIQGMQVTVLRAIYHVVEHFSQHTGQIMWITKARTGADLHFWVVEEGRAQPNW